MRSQCPSVSILQNVDVREVGQTKLKGEGTRRMFGLKVIQGRRPVWKEEMLYDFGSQT